MPTDTYELFNHPDSRPSFRVSRRDFCEALGLDYQLVCALDDAEHNLHALIAENERAMVLLSRVVGKDPVRLRWAARQLDKLGIRNEVRGRRRWVNFIDCLRAGLVGAEQLAERL